MIKTDFFQIKKCAMTKKINKYENGKWDTQGIGCLRQQLYDLHKVTSNQINALRVLHLFNGIRLI